MVQWTEIRTVGDSQANSNDQKENLIKFYFTVKDALIACHVSIFPGGYCCMFLASASLVLSAKFVLLINLFHLHVIPIFVAAGAGGGGFLLGNILVPIKKATFITVCGPCFAVHCSFADDI